MFTVSYRGWWIHGWFDRNEVRVQSPDFVSTRKPSVRAAKAFIRKQGAGK